MNRGEGAASLTTRLRALLRKGGPLLWASLCLVCVGLAVGLAMGLFRSGSSLAPVNRQEDVGLIAPVFAMADSDPVEKPTAPDFSLVDTDGHTVTLSGLRGRPVFLDFWATWCFPCLISMPEVEKLHKEFGNDIHVIGINLDEDPRAAVRYVTRKKISYPSLLAGESNVAGRYGAYGIPHFVLVDADGRIVHEWPGFYSGIGGEWRTAIRRLLSDRTP